MIFLSSVLIALADDSNKQSAISAIYMVLANKFLINSLLRPIQN